MLKNSIKDGDRVQAYNRGLWLDAIVIRVAPNGTVADLRAANPKGKARWSELLTRVVPQGTFDNKKRVAKEEAVRMVESFHAKNRLAESPKLAADVARAPERVQRTAAGGIVLDQGARARIQAELAKPAIQKTGEKVAKMVTETVAKQTAKEQLTAAGKALTAMRSSTNLPTAPIVADQAPAKRKPDPANARGISAFRDYTKTKGENAKGEAVVEYRCALCKFAVSASTTDGTNALGRDARLKAAIRRHAAEKHANE